MTPRLILSNHALERLADRFGWAGDRDTAEAALNALAAVRAYLAIGGGRGRAQIVVPEADMVLGVDDALVCTVLRASLRRAWRETQAVHQPHKKPAPQRRGARAKRRRRTEVVDGE